ncbi:arginine deiminase [Alkalicoccus luteus]|uniref:arginine deiminase n=1 Tax=Alkalicoccus luteus TaxID=1237094 RepID=UPI004034C88C
MTMAVNVTSEIGRLKKVLIHRPGIEIEQVTPDAMGQLLFDDIPYLPAMQKEHDRFAEVLQEQGTEIVYITDLLEQSLQSHEEREQFLEKMMTESRLTVNGSSEALKEYLLDFSTADFVRSMIGGVLKEELPNRKKKHLYEWMDRHYPFYLDPMPNLYFTRDPAAVIGNGISLNPMSQEARRRESLLMEHIITFHPDYRDARVPTWINRGYDFPIEGGDELVLSDTVLAIGVSERTSARAVEKLATELFTSGSGFEKVVAVEIPKRRASMHLDTVFTMIDHDQFTTHAQVVDKDGRMNIFILEPGDPVRITKRSNLKDTLKEVLKLDDVNLIPCGGGDKIASAREQWNDGSNTLAVAPGTVVTYERNYVSNELLRQNGITVLEVPSSELVRGRGGPRCMSMPLVREPV